MEANEILSRQLEKLKDRLEHTVIDYNYYLDKANNYKERADIAMTDILELNKAISKLEAIVK